VPICERALPDDRKLSFVRLNGLTRSPGLQNPQLKAGGYGSFRRLRRECAAKEKGRQTAAAFEQQ
jgi:hypothetical protein